MLAPYPLSAFDPKTVEGPSASVGRKARKKLHGLLIARMSRNHATLQKWVGELPEILPCHGLIFGQAGAFSLENGPWDSPDGRVGNPKHDMDIDAALPFLGGVDHLMCPSCSQGLGSLCHFVAEAHARSAQEYGELCAQLCPEFFYSRHHPDFRAPPWENAAAWEEYLEEHRRLEDFAADLNNSWNSSTVA